MCQAVRDMLFCAADMYSSAGYKMSVFILFILETFGKNKNVLN